MLQNVKSVLIGLTEVGDPQQPSAALGYGLSVAREADAHVTIQAASLKLAVTHAHVSSFARGLISTENRRLQALASAAAELARADASAAGVTCTTEVMHLPYADLIRTFTFQARIHDLTLLDAEPVAIAVDRGLIEAVLMNSGRPLVVVPRGGETYSSAPIIIAWDGSAKAARAVNDALPFLRAATLVDLVVVTGEKNLADAVPGTEIAPHLANHGVKVTVREVPVEYGDVAQTLRNACVQSGAGMLVMGAYVHSRLRQLVLGGTTQSLLKSSLVPLLLSY
jgi:nucleotide-binding universal stress UspA family protein